MACLPSIAAHHFSWYFAYGSNLSRSRIEQRTGSVPTARSAFLRDYRLCFNVHADASSYANIVPCPNGIVWGAAYWLSGEMMIALDRFEGVALGCYRREKVEVETATGERLPAEAYVGGVGSVAAEGRPSSAYLELIVTGAREHNLPEEYIQLVQARGTQCRA